jgi:hypothetical protein
VISLEVLEAVMHSRTGHLTGALVGLAAAFVVGYLLLESAAQLDWNAYLSGPWATAGTPAAVTPSDGIPTVGGSVFAAGMLLVIAIITGLLASSPRLSPLAPLLAGLALLAVGLAGQFAYFQVDSWMLQNLPVTLGPASDTLLTSGIWQLLGGIMLVSAAMPRRWTGKLAPARPARTEIGVLIGLAGIAGLWYLLVNPVGYNSVTGKTGLPDAFDLILMPQAAAAAVAPDIDAAGHRPGCHGGGVLVRPQATLTRSGRPISFRDGRSDRRPGWVCRRGVRPAALGAPSMRGAPAAAGLRAVSPACAPDAGLWCRAATRL